MREEGLENSILVGRLKKWMNEAVRVCQGNTEDKERFNNKSVYPKYNKSPSLILNL